MPRSDKKAVVLQCKFCQSDFECKLSRLKAGGGKYCSQSCRSRDKSGNKSPFFKGRQWINVNGYLEYTDPCGSGEKFLTHRKVMEKHIGRTLKTGEIVHHIDHDKLNNSISNLEIMCLSDHIIHHNKKLDKWSKKNDCCFLCKTTSEPHQAKGLCTVCYKHKWFAMKSASLR